MSPVEDVLVRLAGPLGPAGSLEEQERLRETLKGGDPLVAAGRLLRAVGRQPPLPPNVERATYEFEAAEILGDLAKDPRVRLELERALGDQILRSVALEALALCANPASEDALVALAKAEHERPFLGEDDLVRLASAIGMVGGERAAATLAGLRAGERSPKVRHEIEVALAAIRGDTAGDQ